MAELCYGCFEKKNNPGPCPKCGYDAATQEGKFPHALKPGTILNGQYLIGCVLDIDTAGLLYAARDIQSGQRLEIKEFMNTDLALREPSGQIVPLDGREELFEESRAEFIKEAKTIAGFGSIENIVHVQDIFEANGTACFVTEHVDGCCLGEYVRVMGGKLTEASAKRILLPIMNALDKLHGAGLIHANISPDSIIVGADGISRLTAFGDASRRMGEKLPCYGNLLTSPFAAVEIYSMRSGKGPYSDVYSMAAAFYYAVTGSQPPASIDRLMSDELTMPASLGVKLSPYAEQALLKGLELRASGRYQTMAELAGALRDREY